MCLLFKILSFWLQLSTWLYFFSGIGALDWQQQQQPRIELEVFCSVIYVAFGGGGEESTTTNCPFGVWSATAAAETVKIPLPSLSSCL